jgi:hypothetical protein
MGKNLQLFLGTAEICQLFYLAAKNVTINLFKLVFNEDSKMESAIFLPFVS